jgi:radical SAM superfamily enzyme YgiQ (UPF0313 family)
MNGVGFLPPLGLECIAGVLEPHAEHLQVVDLRKEAGRTIDFILPDTDLVCFSVNWKRDVRFMEEEIRSVPPGIFTLLGGRHATEDPEGWLAACPNADAVVRGDGEEVVEDLCRGVSIEAIPGLSFRAEDRTVHNPNRTLSPLREHTYPNRGLRRHPYEIEVEASTTGIMLDLVSSSRGCPFNCAFCSFSRNPWGKKRQWSARSPASVIEELAQIDAPIVGFTDDLFTYDMDRVERICDLLLAHGIRKKYIVNARLEIARRPDIVRKMERAGFTVLLLGVESAHDRTLRSMRKGFDTAKIRECFSVLRRSSMLLHGYFILGNIGESLDDMLQIAPFAHELGLDTIALSTLRSSPHSGLDELVEEHSGYHITASGKIYSDQHSVRDLKRLRRRIYRNFFTASQVMHLSRKVIRNGGLSFLPLLVSRVPGLACGVTRCLRRRAQRRARRKVRDAIARPVQHVR